MIVVARVGTDAEGRISAVLRSRLCFELPTFPGEPLERRTARVRLRKQAGGIRK